MDEPALLCRYVGMGRWDWIMLGLCGAWLLALLWIAAPGLGLFGLLWTETAAAWVQAVGSVGAICVAIYLARSDTRRADREKALRDEVLRQAACRLGVMARDTLYECADDLDPQMGACEIEPASLLDICRQLDRTMEAFPLLELANPDAINRFMSIRSGIWASIRELEKLVAAPSPTLERRIGKNFRRYAEQVHHSVVRLADLLE